MDTAMIGMKLNVEIGIQDKKMADYYRTALLLAAIYTVGWPMAPKEYWWHLLLSVTMLLIGVAGGLANAHVLLHRAGAYLSILDDARAGKVNDLGEKAVRIGWENWKNLAPFSGAVMISATLMFYPVILLPLQLFTLHKWSFIALGWLILDIAIIIIALGVFLSAPHLSKGVVAATKSKY